MMDILMFELVTDFVFYSLFIRSFFDDYMSRKSILSRRERPYVDMMDIYYSLYF